MNKRTTQILLKVMKDEKGVSFSELSDEFNVSQRTIRNDISTINQFLNGKGLEELKVSALGWIAYTDDKSLAMELILQSEINFYTYKLDKDERRSMIALLLLDSNDYITISAIADEMLISRQTIINDLNEVKKFFVSFNLKIQSNSNKGMRVIGTENNKRNMILSIIYSNIYYGEAQLKMFNPFSELVLQTYFKVDQKEIFEKIIKAEEERNNVFFTDASYMKVLYYSMVVIKRMLHDKCGEIDVDLHYGKHNNTMAREILQYLCNYFHIDCIEDEISLLSEVLASQRYFKNDLANENYALKIQMIATRFISAISEDLDLNLNMDFIFYENLVSHLESTLMQEFSQENANPVLDILTQNYPEIFEITIRHIPIFNEFMGRDMNEHEISYVVMHICAALERKKNTETPAKVIVVCSAGVGTSQLLVEKLKQQFRFEIIDVTSVHNISKRMVDKADFIISTVPLRDMGKDSIIITPILNDSDYLKIQKKMQSINVKAQAREIDQDFSVEKLIEAYKPLIDQYVTLEQRAEFVRELARTTYKFLNKDCDTAIGYCLYELLDREHIQVDVECADYEEAIRAGGRLLLKNKEIEPSYIDAMVENMERNGPYFVISKGFAIPHADTECGVNKIGMSLIRLKNPIFFKDEKLGKIEFVCCLSALDAEGHTKALFDLINLLEEKKFKEAIKSCKSAEEMADIIKKYEEEICGFKRICLSNEGVY